MQTQQEQNGYPFPPRMSTNLASQTADEYVAVFPTSLALARWMRGGDIPHVFSSTRDVPVRAAWYDEAQRRFQSWLEHGGFHAD
ncbi:MAG: hypothetical protein WCC39_14655 [Telluria sp.]